MKGLALSGGAAFGAYQVGVWQALEEAGWNPQVICGISIGSINAWMLSRGATLDELLEIWLDLPEQLSAGLPNRSLLPWTAQTPLFRAWAAEAFERYRDRRPRCKAVISMLEVARLRTVTVSAEEVRLEHLLASCALPGVMAPVRIDGKLYMDCGLLRYIPVEEAVESGATEVIVVDLLAAHPFPTLRKLRNAFDRARNFGPGRAGSAADNQFNGVRQLWIGHPRPLGGILESFRWNRAFVERLIAAGYADAREAIGS